MIVLSMSFNTTIIMDTIMPKFIKKLSKDDYTTYVCSCKKCKDSGKNTAFSNIDDLQKHLRSMKAHLFECPEDDCNVQLWTMSSMITTHIHNDHPDLAKKFVKDGHETAIYCKDCKKYTSFHSSKDRDIHFENHRNDRNASQKMSNPSTKEKITVVQSRKDPIKLEEKSFVNNIIKKIEAMSLDSPELFSKNDLMPLIKNENKYRMEKDCKHGNKCNGFSNGVCAFNHHGNTELNNKSTTICKFERPHEKKRCLNSKCSFDHLSGRVVFVMNKKISLATNFLSDDKTDKNVTVETTETPSVEKTKTPAVEATETRDTSV